MQLYLTNNSLPFILLYVPVICLYGTLSGRYAGQHKHNSFIKNISIQNWVSAFEKNRTQKKLVKLASHGLYIYITTIVGFDVLVV